MDHIIPEEKVRDTLTEFIAIALESEFVFYVAGDDKIANNYIAAMRTQLSRWRSLLKAQHKKIKPFKMLLISITPEKMSTGVMFSKVVLKKSLRNVETLVEFDRALPDLTF